MAVRVEAKTIQLFKFCLSVMEPPPVLTVSEWADTYRIIPRGRSAEPGKWNSRRAPYQITISDAINSYECTEVVVMSSSQIGKTEIILNIIGYYIDNDPSSMLCVQPSLDMAQDFSKKRLAPMIRESPVLRDKVKDVKAKTSENTILSKSFPGGDLAIIGANSPSGLASRPVRILLLDEVDRYPDSAGTEGDPVDLAEKRTNNFWNKKIIKFSTPTIKNVSKIEDEYEDSSMEEWCVKCPCCRRFQPYEWKRIRKSDAKMRCKFCGEYISEIEWKQQEGKFIARHPERKNKRGFHLNEFASPWRKWKDIIADFNAAMKDFKENGRVEKLKVWINTSLGESWTERADKADDNALMKRREMYLADLPEGVLVLTAGVDVQDDRFEIEVVGWGKGYESWGIVFKKIYGDLETDEIWDKLEDYLDSLFLFSGGNGLLIALSCIDTGGHHTQKTYKWLLQMRNKGKESRIVGIKGKGGEGLPLIYQESRNNKLNVKIYILGVNNGKEIIMTRLQAKEGNGGYCHFPANDSLGYDEDYMKGIVSEYKTVEKNKEGRLVVKWKKDSGVRNEPLDCRNYATAAVELLNPNFESLEKKINAGINYMIESTAKKKERKSGIVSRGIQI